MNIKLVAVLSVLAVASSASTSSAFQAASAASSDGSISAEEAAIPACNQTELITVANLMTKNNRKKQCEATLGVSEMVKATDKKTLCSLQSCTVALKSLYVTLPNCKYLDWGIRYNVKRLLEYCTIDPDTISTNPDDYADIEASNSTDSSGSSKETANWTDSSSSVTFAPIGGSATPTPVPTTAQQVTPTTAAPKSAASSSVAIVSSAAAVLAMVASFAL